MPTTLPPATSSRSTGSCDGSDCPTQSESIETKEQEERRRKQEANNRVHREDDRLSPNECTEEAKEVEIDVKKIGRKTGMMLDVIVIATTAVALASSSEPVKLITFFVAQRLRSQHNIVALQEFPLKERTLRWAPVLLGLFFGFFRFGFVWDLIWALPSFIVEIVITFMVLICAKNIYLPEDKEKIDQAWEKVYHHRYQLELPSLADVVDEAPVLHLDQFRRYLWKVKESKLLGNAMAIYLTFLRVESSFGFCFQMAWEFPWIGFKSYLHSRQCIWNWVKQLRAPEVDSITAVGVNATATTAAFAANRPARPQYSSYSSYWKFLWDTHRYTSCHDKELESQVNQVVQSYLSCIRMLSSALLSTTVGNCVLAVLFLVAFLAYRNPAHVQFRSFCRFMIVIWGYPILYRFT